jgi:hypothetical protein
MNRAEVRLEDLPASARELVQAVGLQATLEIVERWGGVGLWIPVDLKPDGAPTRRLADAIGARAAKRLHAVYRGSLIAVPKCDRALRVLRDEEIRTRRAEGITVPSLAREYRLTERQIYNIAAAEAVNDGQADLFCSGT